MDETFKIILKNNELNRKYNRQKLNALLEKASKVYAENFPLTTTFERAVFYSWVCRVREPCKYCYMSTLPFEKRTQEKVRSFASLLAETIITKYFGWDYGFLSGGIGAFSMDKIYELLKYTYEIMQEKVWVNIGIMPKQMMQRFRPFIKGVVGTVETVNYELHDYLAPSKPVSAVEQMFKDADDLGLGKAITLIVGMGETINDFENLKGFIEKHNVEKIHIYGLNIQRGTIFDGSKPIIPEYQAQWIALTRINFPKIDIQLGIWRDRADWTEMLLRAGANTISKYPALKDLGLGSAHAIEQGSKNAGRKFLGTLTKIPEVDFENIVKGYSFDDESKVQVLNKLSLYLKKMVKNIESYRISEKGLKD